MNRAMYLTLTELYVQMSIGNLTCFNCTYIYVLEAVDPYFT